MRFVGAAGLAPLGPEWLRRFLFGGGRSKAKVGSTVQFPKTTARVPHRPRSAPPHRPGFDLRVDGVAPSLAETGSRSKARSAGHAVAPSLRLGFRASLSLPDGSATPVNESGGHDGRFIRPPQPTSGDRSGPLHSGLGSDACR